MLTILARALASAIALASPATAQDHPLAPTHLRCEYHVDPLDLGERKPRFSWEVVDPRRGAVQSAYQIVVVKSRQDLPASPAGQTAWDSGKVASRETCQIEYAGPALESFQHYSWKVRTYDGQGRASPWSEPAVFGMGPLAPADWKAQWIGDASPLPPDVPANNGFHSQFSDKEDDQKWVQIDLGAPTPFDGFRIYPARPYDWADTPGFLFPLKLKIWVADDPLFAGTFMKLVDKTYIDLPNPGTEPLALPIQNATYKVRYVRLGATKLGRIEGKGCAFALAEMEITNGGQVISRGAKATASDSIETGGWGVANLTDGDTVSHGPKGRDPLAAPILRKELALAAPISRATLFASALGLYEIRINGRRVGEDQLAPGWTDYSVRVPYRAYDVTALLHAGKNAIAAQGADGWYAGRLGLPGTLPGGPPRGIYGRKPRFLAQMEIEHGSGARETVATDGSWRSSTAGPVRSTDLLDGEVYDARAEIAGFDSPGFDDSKWEPAEVSTDLHPQLDAPASEPAKIVQVLKPVAMKEPKPGVFVFDLGQNMVGWCRLKISAPAATEVTLRHAEMTEDDGSIYTANLRTASQTDRYLCRGGGAEVFEPRFTCHGFRYVEVTGLPGKPALSDLEGCVVSNSAGDAGTFHASDPLLDRLWTNIQWTLRGNAISIPTDCPQRDERMGWMGDIAAFAQTAAFQRDLAGFFGKWIQDVRDAQADDGRYPDFAPHPYGRNERCTGTPAWGDAGVIVPWVAFLNYGDRRLVEAHLDSMIRWVEWVRSNNPDLVWKNARGSDYRDWLNGDEIAHEGWPKTGGATTGEVLATAYFAHSARLVSRMAASVGRAADAKHFGELSEGIRAAFRKAFVAEDGKIQGDAQGGYALALDFDLLTQAQQDHALARLVENIEKAYDGHLSTGFTSTLPAMLELSRRGHVELATKLALDHRFPSWGYAVDNGATTLWERWDGYVKERGLQDASMNSFNHYAFGAIGEWMMRVLAGLEPDEEHPGWERFTVHPRPSAGITSVKAEHATIRGRIVSAWSREGGTFRLEVTIPANTSAAVIVPAKDAASVSEGGRPLSEAAPHVRLVSVQAGEAVLDVRAGSYHFESRM